jgi:hypothetical protein
MKARHALPLLFSLAAASGAALADDAAILACRALADSGKRLACYDALPLGTPAPSPEQRFGLDNVRRPEDPGLPKQIETTLEGTIEGWGPGTQFKLANGQVWKVSDGSSGTLDHSSNPKVKLVRNAFGTTFIEFEGSNNSAKVRRIR